MEQVNADGRQLGASFGREGAGYLEQARYIFEKMFTYANHLGLYAEQTGASPLPKLV